jgi:hypothetical protein
MEKNTLELSARPCTLGAADTGAFARVPHQPDSRELLWKVARVEQGAFPRWRWQLQSNSMGKYTRCVARLQQHTNTAPQTKKATKCKTKCRQQTDGAKPTAVEHKEWRHKQWTNGTKENATRATTCTKTTAKVQEQKRRREGGGGGTHHRPRQGVGTAVMRLTHKSVRAPRWECGTRGMPRCGTGPWRKWSPRCSNTSAGRQKHRTSSQAIGYRKA